MQTYDAVTADLWTEHLPLLERSPEEADLETFPFRRDALVDRALSEIQAAWNEGRSSWTQKAPDFGVREASLAANMWFLLSTHAAMRAQEVDGESVDRQRQESCGE